MAAVVHGCGNSSPRQHHSNSISCTGLLAGSSHHKHQPHSVATPMYGSTMPKYGRSSLGSSNNPAVPSLSTVPVVAATHHLVYGGGSSTSAMAHPPSTYNPSLAAVTYLPGIGMNAITHQHSFTTAGGGSNQHAPSVPSGGTIDICRNYWGHPSLYRTGRHHNKRKSAVELLAETKPFYIKSDAVLERLQQSNYRAATIAGVNKRGRNGVDLRDDVIRYKPPTYGELSAEVSSAAVEHRFVTPAPQSTHLHQSGARAGGGGGAHLHHHHHSHSHGHTHASITSRHSGVPGNNLLQSKVRMILGNSGNVIGGGGGGGGGGDLNRERSNSGAGVVGMRSYRNELPRKIDFSPKSVAATGGILNSNKELTSLSFSAVEDDAAALHLPPPSFLSPQSFDNVYNYGAENSSGDEPLVLTENYRPISPPAEYAADSSKHESRSRYNYQRSYSHSHEMTTNPNSKYNINSHKSLPDLHSQISRHSPHSEILSCCSRGNRSIKSAGESSLNRDSGGSSGHYTHRSEPCYRQQRDSIDHDLYAPHSGGNNNNNNASKNCCTTIPTPIEYRRDSGSSTQHSANSYSAMGLGGGGVGGGGYASPSYLLRTSATDCAECRCKNGVRFESDDYFFNFTTPEVPEAFQDDYTPPSPSVSKYKIDETRYSSSVNHQLQLQQQQQPQQLFSSSVYGSGSLRSPKSSAIQSPGSATPSIEDISPPPIRFKRQRCIRFKNRNRISLPNAPSQSNSVAAESVERGEQYHSAAAMLEQPSGNYFFPKCFSADGYETKEKSYSEPPPPGLVTSICSNSSSQLCDRDSGDMNEVQDDAGEDLLELQRFFDRLGLNDEKFNEIYSTPRRRKSADSDSEDSSTVFFSDVSTVDSMRLPDSTETQPQTTQPYRPSEPPSIVERNARIIKWLCNCRKSQYS